jgi:hypothetical protein
MVLYSERVRRFGNWICFHPQAKGVGGGAIAQLGSLQRANLYHTQHCVLPEY